MCNFFRVTAFAVVVAASAVAEAQENWRWARNLDEARAIAAQSNKLVLIHFGGKQCRACQELERDVFARPGFGESLARDYVGVKIDAYLFPSMARDFKVELLPTDVIVTPGLEVVERRTSPRTSADYDATMAQIAGDYRQRQSAAATQYQRPVVSYGAVRPASAPSSAAPTNNAPQAPAAPSYAMNPPAQSPSLPPAQPVIKKDRYADYYQQLEQQQVAPPMHDYAGYQTPTAAPAMTPPPAPEAYRDYAAMQQATAPAPSYTAPAPSYNIPSRPVAPAMQPGAAPAGAQAANAATPRSRPAITQEQLPPGSAPLVLDGYCPVTLSEQQRWVQGDVRYGVQHEGRTYLFTNADEQRKFLQQPHRYAPVMAGNDPVLATDNGQLLSGSREHGLFVNGRIYLFASEESLNQFERNRDRYVQSVNRTLR